MQQRLGQLRLLNKTQRAAIERPRTREFCELDDLFTRSYMEEGKRRTKLDSIRFYYWFINYEPNLLWQALSRLAGSVLVAYCLHLE